MEQYEKKAFLDAGGYGLVWKVRHRTSRKEFAVKTLRDRTKGNEEQHVLRELRHPNIVRLHDVIHDSKGNLHMILELMDCDLFRLLVRSRPFFTPPRIRLMAFQLLHALRYVHARGYCHRDVKPENVLYSAASDSVKLADFGFAVRLGAVGDLHGAVGDRHVPGGAPMAPNVGTKWYRAPEQVLRSSSHGTAVDLWAAGIVMIQMITGRYRSVVVGSCDEELFVSMCQLLGAPSPASWPAGLRLALAAGFSVPEIDAAKGNLVRLLRTHGAGEAVIQLVRGLCSWDPAKRPTAEEALRHPYFEPCLRKCAPAVPPVAARLAASRRTPESRNNNNNNNKSCDLGRSRALVKVEGGLRSRNDVCVALKAKQQQKQSSRPAWRP